ncbi:hypothetical protein BJJLLNOG_00036 [Ostreid herpesvirus 1]|nr:hypothetical protein MHEDPEIF_00039 [Ostreid herpesvirus 1]UPX73171.1 hypothetical protein ANDDGIFB_00040 [Ostreid herpesvirus 1]UPX73505.1 hypothetical protein HCIIPDEM_00038 [Ostreid herpesvirus 1]UPX73671.1 hypothetical protein FOIOAHAI_00039 [Ostreid herpesvirus 1]UPX73838.1 hypothetical protein HKALIGHD_00039 [Ostreid herpesvirus 1]
MNRYILAMKDHRCTLEKLVDEIRFIINVARVLFILTIFGLFIVLIWLLTHVKL